MVYLPLANILHRKLRSSLSVLGIGIGVCMLITLTGLTRGSLFESAQRWENIDADLLVYPDVWDNDVVTMAGVGLEDAKADLIRKRHGDLVRRVVPVFLWRLDAAGQAHLSAGVDPEDWSILTRHEKPSEGSLFAPKATWRQYVQELERKQFPAGRPEGAAVDVDRADELERYGWLEMVIDSRLARAGHFRVGQFVTTANHRWKIVGIVPDGGMARIYVPRRIAQHLFGNTESLSTMFFVKLRSGANADAAIRALAAPRQRVAPIAQYRSALREKWGIMFVYVDAVNGLALLIAFLFITITLHTMVLERTREIAILKANGASAGFLIRQVLAESLLLTTTGTAVGIALSFAARWGIHTFKPLLTVTIEWPWILVAILAGAAGAILSAIYPACRAARVDMTEALTLE
jgi:ABC-type antimicrobial peptide transport system permease subunit